MKGKIMRKRKGKTLAEDFFRYFLSQISKVFMLFIIYVVFYGIMLLENQKTSAVHYAFSVSLFLCLITGLLFAYRYHKNMNVLREFIYSKPYYHGNLPTPLYGDEMYHRGLLELRDALFAERKENRKFINDTVDYYTVWLHQIKTPISAIKLLLDADDTAENGILRSELFKIEAYADMALAYLRLDDKVSDYVIKEYSIDEILRDIIRKHSNQFIIKKLYLNYEGTEAKVVTDSKWLKLLLEQILSNSIKYTQSGGVSIWCSQIDGRLEIHISDTGIGISEEDLPRIFDKGYTGYNGRLEEKSTGLGLYLSNKISEKLGCEIEVSSHIGKGSEFTVKFPKKPNESGL